MTKSIELIKELGTKLGEDRANTTPKDEGDLYYTMTLNLRTSIQSAIREFGINDSVNSAVLDSMTKNASKLFLHKLITMSKKYDG